MAVVSKLPVVKRATRLESQTPGPGRARGCAMHAGGLIAEYWENTLAACAPSTGKQPGGARQMCQRQRRKEAVELEHAGGVSPVPMQMWQG